MNQLTFAGSEDLTFRLIPPFYRYLLRDSCHFLVDVGFKIPGAIKFSPDRLQYIQQLLHRLLSEGDIVLVHDEAGYA